MIFFSVCQVSPETSGIRGGRPEVVRNPSVKRGSTNSVAQLPILRLGDNATYVINIAGIFLGIWRLESRSLEYGQTAFYNECM